MPTAPARSVVLSLGRAAGVCACLGALCFAAPVLAQSEVPELLGGPAKPAPAPERPRLPPPSPRPAPAPQAEPAEEPETRAAPRAAPRAEPAPARIAEAPPPAPAPVQPAPRPAPPPPAPVVVLAEPAPAEPVIRLLPPPAPAQPDRAVRSIDLAEVVAPAPARVQAAAYRPAPVADDAAAAASFCVSAADGALRADGFAGAVANGPPERVRRTVYDGDVAPTRLEIETPVIATRGWGREYALATCQIDGASLRSITFRWLGAAG